MSSLKERIELLESDLKAVPPRISVYHDLPFAILRYDPAEEWELRREVKLPGDPAGGGRARRSTMIPMSEFLWRAIDETEGMEEVVELERSQGLHRSPSDQVTTYLSEPDLETAGDDARRAAARSSTRRRSVVFLTRAAAMAPGIYFMSKLLDEMHGKTRVTTILFYPGSIEGTTGLRFMDLKDRDALGNYRVKIYG